MGERPDESSSKPASNVSKFSTGVKGLTNQMSMADVFVKFFGEDCRAGHLLDLNSDSWKEDLSKPEKKALKNKFAIIKHAVRFVLVNSDSCPAPDKESLRRTAIPAEEHIRANLEFGNKRISVHTLTSHPVLRNPETSLKLPDDAPEDACKFFNSNRWVF